MSQQGSLGFDCFVGDLDAAAAAVVDRGYERAGGYVVCCNVHVLTASGRMKSLQQALESAWLVVPDGAPVAWLLRRTGAKQARRVAGPDLMLAVLETGRSIGLRHFLFGSTPRVLDALTRELEQKVPGVEIVGAYSPRPREEDSPEALSSITSAQPHIVWVALGAPRQELWLHRHAGEINAVGVGVGAAFDFHAGTKPRAPEWAQRSGFEWLHRFISEPSRLGPRYLQTNPSFFLLAGRELLRRDGGEELQRIKDE